MRRVEKQGEVGLIGLVTIVFWREIERVVGYLIAYCDENHVGYRRHT